MNKTKGQLLMSQIITWAITLAVAGVGGLSASLAYSRSKIDSLNEKNTAIVERTAKLEEAVETIKDSTKTIQSDIKDILRILNKK